MADTKLFDEMENSKMSSDVSVIEISQSSEDNLNTNGAISKSKDAFDVLMKSRSKVIGSNSPGKELQTSLNGTDDGSKETKSKRKLFLEEWAMMKGGRLNNQKEIMREEAVKTALKRRKVKFTKMLVKPSDDASQEKPKSTSPPNILKKHKISTPKSVTKKAKAKRNIIVSDDEEFLEKLSPSLKKTENLLCYLKKEKVEKIVDRKSDSSDSCDSIKVVNQIKVKITSKRINSSAKKRKIQSPHISKESSSNSSQKINDVNENNDNACDKIVESVNGENTQKPDDFSDDDSNQPRRSRRIKTKKSTIKHKKNILVDSLSSNSSDDDCIMIKSKTSRKGKENIVLLSDSSPNSKTNKKSKTDNPPSKKIKLAPLFTKGVVKPLIDPEVLKARQDFLYSSLDSSTKPQSEPIIEESNVFHIVSHIKQIPDADNPEFYIWNLPLLVNDSNDDELLPDKTWDLKNLALCISNNDDLSSEVFSKIQTYNMKDGLSKLKTIHPKYPIIKFYKQMRYKHYNLKKNALDAENINEECSIVESSNQENAYTDKYYDNVLWTEKYKPLSSNESIGNFKSVDLLKKWLTSWKESGKELSSVLKKKIDSDSSSEFWSSDSNSRQSSGFIDNTYVLSGPVGSGKTSTVYSIANELNINVIEVNASSKRTGKKILLKLQEATQSHKIGNKSDKNDDKQSFFTNKNDKSEKKMKKRKSKANENPSNSKDKMSLILIEDADIVFEEDDGFVNALSQIVRFSKRPVIIVTTEVNCPHLKKFISEHNIVKFHPLSGNIVSPWFNLLMLMESGKIYPTSQLLVHFNRGDVRKTIMQMQSWILGNRTNDSNVTVDNNSFNEENTSHLDGDVRWDTNAKDDDDSSDSKSDSAENILDVLSDIVYLSPKQKVSWNIAKFHCNISNDVKLTSHDIKFDSLCCTLDVISSIDHLQSFAKNIPESGVFIPRWCNIGDNLLDVEREDEYCEDFTSDYCNKMIACDVNLQNSLTKVSLQDAFSVDFHKESWRKKQNLVYDKLCEFVPESAQLDRRSLNADYLAYMRNICNSEKLRQDTNIKRNNRFHHYFSSLNADFNEKTSKIFKSN